MLSDISGSFAAEAHELEACFLAGGGCPRVAAYQPAYGPHVDGCVISLWDAWNRFVRSLLLASCAGPTVGNVGLRYSPKASLTETQALLRLKTEARRRRIVLIDGEPRWYERRILPDLAIILDIPNAQPIIAAVGASVVVIGSGGAVANPIPELQSMRNFIAHKTPATLAKAVQYVSVPAASPHEHLWEKVSGGVERFCLWAATLRALADASCA